MAAGQQPVTVAELVQDTDLRGIFPRLPDYLQTRFTSLPNIESEIEELKRNLEELQGEEIPAWTRRVCEERIKELEAQIVGLNKVAAAARLGYEPYTPPAEWWGGSLAPVQPWQWVLTPENTNDRKMNPLDWIFQAPIPPTALRKYVAAKQTGLFDQFLVVSPDRSHFRRLSSLYTEPVIVGYVSIERWPVRFGWKEEPPHLVVRKGTGFWIAGWDLLAGS